MWLLTQTTPPADGSKPVIFRLPRGRSNVGRKDQPVLIAEKSVSRNHGYVTSDGKTLKVGDGGSKFGTHVDGKKVSSESEVQEGQVIRFGGREDGSADFRASKESVLIALTACGEKHAAFKTQALTCGLDVIGEHDAWPQVPLACVSTADPSKKKPFSVACLRAAALGVKLVQPSYLEAWQSRNPLSEAPPAVEDHLLPSSALLQRIGESCASALENLKLVFVGDALGDLQHTLQSLGFKDQCPSVTRAQASATTLPACLRGFTGKVAVVSADPCFGPLAQPPRFFEAEKLVAALVDGAPLASVDAASLVPTPAPPAPAPKRSKRRTDETDDGAEPEPAPAPAPRRSPKRKAREAPSPAPKRSKQDDAEFDEAAATRQAKKLKVAELRAALEDLGEATDGTKPILVERLVGARRRAASAAPAEPSPEPPPPPSPEPSPAAPPEPSPEPSPAPKRPRRSPKRKAREEPSPPPKRQRAAEEEAPPPPPEEDDDDEFDLAAAMDAPRAAPAPAPQAASPSPPPRRKRRAAEEEEESPAPVRRKKKRREEEPVVQRRGPTHVPPPSQRKPADTTGGGWLSTSEHAVANDDGGDVDPEAALAAQLADQEPEVVEEAPKPKAKRGGRSTKPSKAEEARQLDAFAESGARDKELDKAYANCVAPRAPTVVRDLVVARKERPATASKKKKGPNFKRFRKNAVRVAPASDIVTGDYLDKLAAAESETELQLRRDAAALAQEKARAEEDWDDDAAPKPKRKPAARKRR